ncbi:hypothetical protein BGW80DRAFT_1555972, partial [Lactifluus volemus]
MKLEREKEKGIEQMTPTGTIPVLRGKDPLIDAVREYLANPAEFEVVPHCAPSLARSGRGGARRDCVQARGKEIGVAHVYVGIRG